MTVRLAAFALAPAVALYVGAAAVLSGGGSEPMIGQPWPLPTIATRGNALALPIVAKGAAFRGATKTPTPRPTATASPTPTRAALRPASADELKRAVTTPGALVEPVCGAYRMRSVVQVATDVTVNGRGCVTILDKTVELHEADGATLRNLRIVDAGGDGIRVTHTRSALIEGVHVSGSGDGEIDVAEGPDDGGLVVIRDSTIGPGRKCQLLGDQDQPQDSRMTVILERVVFTDCHVRTPKVHRSSVKMIDCTIYHWTGPRLDVQLGGVVAMRNTTWIAGPKSMPGYHLPTGGRVIDEGSNVYRPWGGAE